MAWHSSSSYAENSNALNFSGIVSTMCWSFQKLPSILTFLQSWACMGLRFYSVFEKLIQAFPAKYFKNEKLLGKN